MKIRFNVFPVVAFFFGANSLVAQPVRDTLQYHSPGKIVLTPEFGLPQPCFLLVAERNDQLFYILRQNAMVDASVDVAFDLSGKSVNRGSFVAIQRGPVVLARDTRFADGLVDEVGVVKTENGKIVLDRVDPLPGMWMAFGVKMLFGTNLEHNNGYVTVRLCDYASAGNDWNPGTRYRVWLPAPLNVRQMPYSPDN